MAVKFRQIDNKKINSQSVFGGHPPTKNTRLPSFIEMILSYGSKRSCMGYT